MKPKKEAMESKENKVPEFLSGGGEMGERIRNFDWTKTPLGPPANWEQSLKTCVRIMLASSQPIWIGWSNQLIKLYNDPYKAIVGGKHPAALGQPASVVWKDIEPLLKQVMEKDEGTYVESQLLIMERNNYPEETYYTFSYTPIPGENGRPAGMICANTDDTARIINERALQTLRDLGKLSYREKSIREIYTSAAKILSENNKDFPLAQFYEIDEKTMHANAIAWAGDEGNYNFFPKSFNILTSDENTKNLRNAITNNQTVVSENNGRRKNIPTGFWPIPPKQFLHIPLTISNNKLPGAILTVGLNPFRKYDTVYQQFIQLLSDQLSLEISNIYALEAERKRAEALAEIDKAKTIFFNNISHEFRTPLTLMLGPLEELMKQPEGAIGQKNQASIETTHRNAMRLLKLVNTLLDFSRIESGRQQANFTQVDIGSFTRSLASNFNSVVEKGGLELIIKTDTIQEPVYVDKQMWEKIVFNLLSNAFKYTLNGSIQVNLFSKGNNVVLQVKDTGAGIPANELPHMFERFHRVKGTSGRTYEGTGIGLSLIKELVGFHSGTIGVESEVGRGSTFTVTIPTGREHLPASNINPDKGSLNDVISDAFVEEAYSLIDNVSQIHGSENQSTRANGRSKTASILIVDDNADMRDYIKGLLSKDYNVTTAVNGMDALEKMKQAPPDLVLSDVMMPVMDGIQLLNAIKQDADTGKIPVVLLSARAGEEARIQGIDTGADDYLTKPFSARELLARISSQLRIADARKRTEDQLRNLFLQAPLAISIVRGPEYIVEIANEKQLALWDRTQEEVLNKPVFEILPEAKGQGFEQILDSVYKTGQRFVSPESPVSFIRNGKMENIYVKFVYEPLRDEDGKITGIMAVTDEITEQVLARKKIEESEERFRTLAQTLPQLVWVTDNQGNAEFASKRWFEFTGIEPADEATWRALVHPDDFENNRNTWVQSLASGTTYKCDVRLKSSAGGYRWYTVLGEPVLDGENKIVKWVGAFTDIHDTKSFTQELERQVLSRTEELGKSNKALASKNDELEKMNKELQSFAYVSSHDLQEPLRKIQTFATQILEKENENLTERGKNYFGRMQDAAERMQQLIEDLLTYSRTSTGERKYERTDLKMIVEQVKEELKEGLEQKHAILEIGEMCEANIIPFQFRQLMYNLIGNSLKFSKPGVPPVIKIKSEIISNVPLKNEKATEGKVYCHIAVADNGIGFEPEYQEKIFEVFQRLHGRTAYSGTGIGLAIVKKIVENHNGFIMAKGVLNEGATFDIYIPVN